MHATPDSRHRRRLGFSLVELSVVVVILGIVATLGLEVAANFVSRSGLTVTRDRLKAVDEATANFFKIYGRLPCPVLITLAPSNVAYGLENCSLGVLTSTTIGGGVMEGAVPYRTLGLPMSVSLDGFNNKIWYAVTKNLTVSGGTTAATNRFASTGGTTATDGQAGIEVRTGQQEATCSAKCQLIADPTAKTGAAYLLYSGGPDGRGAYNARGVNKTVCATATDARVDTQNCVYGTNATRLLMSVTTIPYNTFYDNRYNAGLNLASYFGDLVIWRRKDQL